jgi:hypothetical protein
MPVTHCKKGTDAELLEEQELRRALVTAWIQQLRHLVTQFEGSRLLHCTTTHRRYWTLRSPAQHFVQGCLGTLDYNASWCSTLAFKT